MAINIGIDDLDTLTLKKIHQITATQEGTIQFLQKLKLLPVVPTTIEQCGDKNNHGWYLAEYTRLKDGKSK
jgi:hypothetical protein